VQGAIFSFEMPGAISFIWSCQLFRVPLFYLKGSRCHYLIWKVPLFCIWKIPGPMFYLKDARSHWLFPSFLVSFLIWKLPGVIVLSESCQVSLFYLENMRLFYWKMPGVRCNCFVLKGYQVQSFYLKEARWYCFIWQLPGAIVLCEKCPVPLFNSKVPGATVLCSKVARRQCLISQLPVLIKPKL